MLFFSRTLVQSKRNVSYRPKHDIDIDAFSADILKSDIIRDPKGHISDMCKQYYHVFKALLNKHWKSTSHNAENPRQLWNSVKKSYTECLLRLYLIISQSSLYLTRSPVIKKNSQTRSTFPDHTFNPVQVHYPHVNSLLPYFTFATGDDVRKIITSSPNKLCDFDPLPTILLKACLYPKKIL